MPDVLTYAVEIAVGVGCLIGVPAAWRSRRTRWLAVVLVVAGAAAVVHGALALATR